MRPLRLTGGGVIPRQRPIMAARWAGVVPQQPPSSQAPPAAIASMSAAKASGLTSKTVRPFSLRGSPALGLTITGREAQAISSGSRPFI